MKSKISLRMGKSHSLFRYQSVHAFLLLCSTLCEIQGAPPETIGIPILKSILTGKSSEGLKELMQSHSSKLLSHLSDSQVSQAGPGEINNLINKLKPTQSQLDPLMTDVLSALDRTYRDTTAAAGTSSTEQFPNEPASNRIASSTEESNVIWQDTTYRPRKRERDSTKFSSRYRSTNKHNTPSPAYNGNLHKNTTSADNATEHGDSSLLPFNHVTDPNLRNHRLYDWEFETYKNFTHIDQAEDLMADEDHATETKVSVVAAPPPLNHPSNQQSQSPEKPEKNIVESITVANTWAAKANTSKSKSKRVKVKGYPHIVISLEDTSDHPFGNGQESYNLHLPMDSGEHSLNQRPREPLRHSSTENIVYVHGDSGEEDRYPYSALSHPSMHEMEDRYADGRSPQQFRPSAADLSDAVFMDPDQDFFTSTLRNSDTPMMSDQDVSSETHPKRRRKKLKKITKKEELDELTQAANRFNNRADNENSYRDNHGIHYSPEYSKNSVQGSAMSEDRARAHLGNIQHTTGPHLPLMKPPKYAPLMESTRMKSDRVLTAGDAMEEYGMMNQGQPMNPSYDQYESTLHHHDGGIGNYYSLHSDPAMHPQMGPSALDHNGPYGHKNNYELTSTEYLGTGNRIQNALSALNLNNLFGGQQATKKLTPAAADQVIAPGNIEDFYHPYAASDHQVNQYYEDSYATSWSNTWFILAGLIAFTAMFALMLPLFLSPGRMGKKDHRHDLDEEDLINTSTYTGSGSNNNYHYDNTNNDMNQNSDLWTEVKGVYNDLVSMLRGDYSLLSKIKKVPEGPKIVYRDEELEDEDSDEEEEDDEKDNKMKVRNRKRDQYIKKQQQIMQKQQQQELKRQQQKQQQQQQQQQATQAKSHNGLNKKTLVSKIKAEAARDNKDNGKTIQASSVNNLVVVSGPGGAVGRKIEDEEEEHSSPRAVTGFVLPENGTLATMAMPFVNTTGYGNAADSFLREWAQVQLINNH